MEPHELIDALIRRSGKSTLELAKLMHRASFQGTLYKVSKGLVRSPKRDTAELIAKYFHIPVDALYETASATRVARDLKLSSATSAPRAEESSPRPYLASMTDSRLSDGVIRRIATLDATQLQHLEQLITAHLDAVQPMSAPGKRRAS